VPRRLEPNELVPLTITRKPDSARPTWIVTWQDRAGQASTGKEAVPITDLFAEAPRDWAFATRKAEQANSFVLTASEGPKGAERPDDPIVLTFTTAEGGFETQIYLAGVDAVR
jgi:hypothetical protein